MQPWSWRDWPRGPNSLQRSHSPLKGDQGRQRDRRAQQLVHRPTKVGQARRHRRCPVLSLEPTSRLGGDPQDVMLPAEVVRTSHQVHPTGQNPIAPRDRPTAPHQRAHRRTGRRVEPLDVRRVDPRPLPGRRQHSCDRLGRPDHHATSDVYQATATVIFDDLAQERPADFLQSRATSPAGPHGVAEDQPEGGDEAGQAIDANERTSSRSATRIRESC
jgi:hypothetical protein